MLYFLQQDCNINVMTLFSKLTKCCAHNVNTTGGMSEDDHLSLNVRYLKTHNSLINFIQGRSLCRTVLVCYVNKNTNTGNGCQRISARSLSKKLLG
jgi:hypothetical protein